MKLNMHSPPATKINQFIANHSFQLKRNALIASFGYERL